MSTLQPLVALNPPLVLAVLALATVQLIKFTSTLIVQRRIDFQRLTGTGGMPSSHAASVAALATAVGLEEGWRSPVFGVAAFFSLIVMYDAAGIRRAAGRQARILNRMIDDLKAHHVIGGERLIELLGHTPLEVFTGTAYGIALALVLHP
ncbi:MAG TPA: divergent PAP2 family protein [Longimicrobiales bacterium]